MALPTVKSLYFNLLEIFPGPSFMMDECFRRTDRQSLLLAGCVCLYRKLEEWEREFDTGRRKEGRQSAAATW